MAENKLNVATCQFAVSNNIKANAKRICQYIRSAKDAGAEIVHFSECALSGYVGTDFATFDDFDWQLLREQTEKIIKLASETKIWVVLGSVHQLSGGNNPHNSLYLIGPSGGLMDRYDKRFCTPGDLRRHTPGNRSVHFTINGVKCSLLICFDLRFPELYRHLRRENVQCVFQSFYNARQSGPSIHTHIMRQTMQCHAATNYFWVSMSNSSGHYAPYPSCFIQPDGKIVAQLKSNHAGFMVNTVDTEQSFYDPSGPYRDMAMRGRLNNGPEDLDDPRSLDTKHL
jgi:predicted amidohydrolase